MHSLNSGLDFRSEPGRWLREWSARYPQDKCPPLDDLLSRHDRLTTADIEYIGNSKDGCARNSAK